MLEVPKILNSIRAGRNLTDCLVCFSHLLESGELWRLVLVPQQGSGGTPDKSQDPQIRAIAPLPCTGHLPLLSPLFLHLWDLANFA